MKKYKHTVFDIISSIMLLVFLYTGISKIWDHNNFQFSMEQATHLKAFAALLSWLIPTVELLIVVMLFFPVTRLKGIYTSLLSMLIFTAYLCCMVFSGSKLPCNCGGVITKLSWGEHIIFNLFLVLLLSLAIFLYNSAKKLSGDLPP